MFPLPFNISPLLLSILVFYPWALALGVWQVGKLTSRGSNTTSAQVCDVESIKGGVDRIESGTDPLFPLFAAHAVPATHAGIDLLLATNQRFSSPDSSPAVASPAIAHLTPRAPPAFS